MEWSHNRTQVERCLSDKMVNNEPMNLKDVFFYGFETFFPFFERHRLSSFPNGCRFSLALFSLRWKKMGFLFHLAPFKYCIYIIRGCQTYFCLFILRNYAALWLCGWKTVRPFQNLNISRLKIEKKQIKHSCAPHHSLLLHTWMLYARKREEEMYISLWKYPFLHQRSKSSAK